MRGLAALPRFEGRDLGPAMTALVRPAPPDDDPVGPVCPIAVHRTPVARANPLTFSSIRMTAYRPEGLPP